MKLKRHKLTKIIVLFGVLILIALGIFLFRKSQTKPTKETPVKEVNPPKITETAKPAKVPTFSMPLENAKSRVLKKPFGIYITPATSPVQPERFSGYHTGTDFEVTAAELNQTVKVFAVCAGKIIAEKRVSGYGGVIVESCHVNGEPVTVLYGHLNIQNSPKVGTSVKAGEQIAVLGAPYSSETDGERKHLHLSVHRGTNVVFLGYVQTKTALSNWIDPLSLM